MKRKTKTNLEKFSKKVEEWGVKLLDEKKGYILLAFNELEDGSTECGYLTKGKITSMVECLYSCMNTNPMLANIIMAASNALVQTRMAQEKLQETIQENVEL